ncbi:MAG: prolyl-tRNA synthetase associated domain-containing protein [Bacilli bacterium]|jgi:Ala-tRNA(Pro) deacylase|nr:prolyl-tRNA synthetase associated domain-containing protein [Bacilli bacterium]
MNVAEQKVYFILEQLNIKYEKLEHPPVYTLDEFIKVVPNLKGSYCKNLFLRNKKGNQHYLVIYSETKKVNLKKLTKELNEDNLSFASPARLNKYLGLEAGSVSPFGVINDKEHHVIVILDKNIKEQEWVNFHPNLNTITITIKYLDLIKFLKYCGNQVKELSL